MSIQRKLMLTISLLMFIILTLNVLFSHIQACSTHRDNLSQQIDTLANQLTISLELIEDTNHTLELEMARSLYGSAKAAEQLLPANHADITNEQLQILAEQLNVHAITLWIHDDKGELLSIKSSDQSEFLIRSNTWDYWNTAMQEIFQLQPVSVIRGETFPHFYSSPLSYFASDPTKLQKFGYYYTGKTNYMINTTLSTDQTYNKDSFKKHQSIVNSILSHVDSLVEITAMNPDFFGKEQTIKLKNGQQIQSLDTKDIIFGEYTYTNLDADVQAVKTAIHQQQTQTVDFKLNNVQYSRVFVPIFSHDSYIISFVFNKKTMLQSTHDQLLDHIFISVVLLIVTIIVTNFVSKQFVAPILLIKEKVKHIANQNFSYPLHIKSKDELGVLATHVNEMTSRLESFTTELQQTASQLQHTEHQLKSIITLTNDPIAMLNLNYEFYNVNSAFINLFEYSFEELEGKSLNQLNPDQASLIYSKLESIVDNGFVDKCELELLTGKGETKHISLTLSPILDMNEQCIGLAGIMHDMTSHYDKKLLLLQNEKLSTISQISASIAHEFRNPLTTLHGFLKLSEQRGHLSAEYIPTLLNELEHMELILGQFLTMAKPQSYTMNKINVNHLLKDITHLLKSSGKLDHIELVWHTEQEPHFVYGDNKYIRQAFVNLIKNSIEAIPQKGIIIIGISTVDDIVEIKLGDNGKGISKEHLAKIFEPFFTNKESGTGLGLLVTQQIIHSHHGTILYESELNAGTTVTVRLPKYVKT